MNSLNQGLGTVTDDAIHLSYCDMSGIVIFIVFLCSTCQVLSMLEATSEHLAPSCGMLFFHTSHSCTQKSYISTSFFGVANPTS